MILTKEQVLKLKDMLLSDPDLSALAEEIDKVTDNRDIEIGKIIFGRSGRHREDAKKRSGSFSGYSMKRIH